MCLDFLHEDFQPFILQAAPHCLVTAVVLRKEFLLSSLLVADPCLVRCRIWALSSGKGLFSFPPWPAVDLCFIPEVEVLSCPSTRNRWVLFLFLPTFNRSFGMAGKIIPPSSVAHCFLCGRVSGASTHSQAAIPSWIPSPPSSLWSSALASSFLWAHRKAYG